MMIHQPATARRCRSTRACAPPTHGPDHCPSYHIMAEPELKVTARKPEGWEGDQHPRDGTDTNPEHALMDKAAPKCALDRTGNHATDSIASKWCEGRVYEQARNNRLIEDTEDDTDQRAQRRTYPSLLSWLLSRYKSDFVSRLTTKISSATPQPRSYHILNHQAYRTEII